MITVIVFAIGMTAMALIVDGDADFYETKKGYPAFSCLIDTCMRGSFPTWKM